MAQSESDGGETPGPYTPKHLGAGPQGMRGEGNPALADPPAEQTHELKVGRETIAVQESSGTAFAEATGRAGPDAQREGAKGDE